MLLFSAVCRPVCGVEPWMVGCLLLCSVFKSLTNTKKIHLFFRLFYVY
jgi:hypothetical protein